MASSRWSGVSRRVAEWRVLHAAPISASVQFLLRALATAVWLSPRIAAMSVAVPVKSSAVPINAYNNPVYTYQQPHNQQPHNMRKSEHTT